MSPAVELPGLFKPEECARIIARRAALGFDAAPIPVRRQDGGKARTHEVDPSVRHTERTHILHCSEDAWIFDRLAQGVEAANQRAWRFRISYLEPLQLLRYPPGGHFDWHSDLGDRGLTALRKVSATILLSAPTEYAGGDLQLMDGGKQITPQRGQGNAAFFPAFQNHRVTEVESGARLVLILWTLGKHALR